MARAAQSSSWIHRRFIGETQLGQRTLVVQQLFSGLGGVLGVGALDDGVDGARLLAETAVDALGHVDIVLGRSAGSVGSLLGLDGDGLGGADLIRGQHVEPHCRAERDSYGLAELAGNASLLTRGVSSKCVLASESGGDGALRRVSSCFGPGRYVSSMVYLLEGVVDGVAIPSSVSQSHRLQFQSGGHTVVGRTARAAHTCPSPSPS